jgi:catechol 2,3-dioxygenase-like lactoylglutathione lyase family enzyme
MSKSLETALFAFALLAAPAAFAAETAAAPAPTPAKPVFVQGYMNVYRRFSPDIRDKMIEFYNQVLGLQSLNPINLGRGQQMLLYKVGAGQLKLASGLNADRKYHPAGLNEAVGIREYTFYFPDEAALTRRFTAAGYRQQAALVQDPGGFSVELIIAPNAPPETYGKVDVGINVSDLNKSEAFYRDFVGLEQLPPVKDAFLGVTKHPYRNGTTTIELWSVGKNLPADTGSAGIQYIVNNVDAVDALAKARNVTIETPLGGVAGFNIRTVWLNDPDGATNYFYQLLERSEAAK